MTDGLVPRPALGTFSACFTHPCRVPTP